MMISFWIRTFFFIFITVFLIPVSASLNSQITWLEKFIQVSEDLVSVAFSKVVAISINSVVIPMPYDIVLTRDTVAVPDNHTSPLGEGQKEEDCEEEENFHDTSINRNNIVWCSILIGRVIKWGLPGWSEPSAWSSLQRRSWPRQTTLLLFDWGFPRWKTHAWGCL